MTRKGAATPNNTVMRIQTTLALALTTAAARSVERPPLACDRDERLWRAWNVVAPEPANWSRATMDAAERFLDGAARPRLRRRAGRAKK